MKDLDHITGSEALLSAMIAGRAKWLPFSDLTSGEVSFNGLRYSCETDSFGLPIISPNLYVQLVGDLRARREAWL